jgi:predicted RNase H-like HicB family nuclease
MSYTVSCYDEGGISKLCSEVMLTMVRSYTAKYTKISSGYMGQLVEWPEIITEGKTIEECREMLRDAVREMILAYKQQDKEIPLGGDLLEQMLIEA